MDMIKEHDAKYVDFRFTDPRGKWQHLTYHVKAISADVLAEGVMFDGSSIAGWKAINESDMLLMPDCTTAVLDPFAAQTSLILFCDCHEPGTGQPYGRDPRSIGKKAEKYLASTGIGDKAFFGPEAEFFVFDDVRYKVGMQGASYAIEAEESPYSSDKIFPDGNPGHRPPIKGGYFPVPPVDSTSDLRAEMLSTMAEMGLNVEKHHHEVAPSQHELGHVFQTLVKGADQMQIYKYVVAQVAAQYGKTATFMPKPIKGDNGSGMHTHQSIWKGDKPLFAGSGYADLQRHGALLYRRHHQARQGDQRLHQPHHQQLQAPHSRLRGAGAAGLFGAQPLGLVPHPDRLEPQGQARRGALPRSGLQPLSRLRGDADGRASTASRTASIRATRWTRTSTTCRPRS